MAATWGTNTWGANSWQSETVTVSLTGVSATSSVGSVEAYATLGWGSDYWGYENWGESAITVSLTGVSATTTLGSPTPGWGDIAWNNSSFNGWGYPVISQQQMGLTGVSATTA